MVEQLLRQGGDAPTDILSLRAQVRERHPAFHWMLEFPEVFYAERRDPLEGGHANRAAWIDAFIGNPPFAGKNVITESNGEGYIDWLKSLHEGAHGAADLCAHFFRRAFILLGKHGTLGLIATNTIAQGDTRASGLATMLRGGGLIYEATRSIEW